jgi:2,4-dienoyl-CoA reductase (NADPH2)
VAVIGGGAVGVETALFLAEKGTASPEIIKFLLINKAEPLETLFDMATRGSKTVSLIEMTHRMGKDIGKSTRWGMMQDLRRLNVETRTAAKVLKITETGIELETDGNITAMNVDTVVVAAGAESYNPLAHVAEKLGIAYHVTGDALKIVTAFDAVHGAYAAAVSI